MSKKVVARKCAVCGKKFKPAVANAKYCSDKCYKAAKAKRDKKRKHAKKPVVLKEKIVLPKKPVKKGNLRVVEFIIVKAKKLAKKAK